jgi:hypothetical protein
MEAVQAVWVPPVWDGGPAGSSTISMYSMCAHCMHLSRGWHEGWM